MKERRRSKTDICRDILNILLYSINKRMKATKLMALSNISYGRLKNRYLPYLKENGYVKQTTVNNEYSITNKGIDYYIRLKVIDFLKEGG